MSKPNSKQQPRKTKEQLKKEEDELREQERLERERLAEVARVPRNFTDYALVELVMHHAEDVNKLIQLLSTELKLHDYMINLRSSILIDFHVHNIDFAKSHGYNLRQSSLFLHLMDQTRMKIVEEHCTIADLISFLKEKLIEYSRPLSIQEQEEWRLSHERRMKQKEAEEKALQNQKKRPTTSNKGKKTDDESKRLEEEEKRKQEEEEAQRRREEEVELLSKSPAFNYDDIAAITDFASVILQHYELYRFVFGQDQTLEITQYRALIELLPEASLPLSEHLEEELYIEKQLALKQQEEERLETIRREKEERMRMEAEEAEKRYQEELAAKRAKMVLPGDVQKIAEYISKTEADTDGLKEVYLTKLGTIQTIVEDAISSQGSQQPDKHQQ